MEYAFIDTAKGLNLLSERWAAEGVGTVAMDFEEESNLHCYGEHVCTIQLFDGRDYHLVDALALGKSDDGLAAMKAFLEGPIQKIMFACQSDAALARKSLGIQLSNVYDIRVLAMALGFTGNLTGLIERNMNIRSGNPRLKKRYQTANWIRRPIPKGQIEYAFGDVRYLFALKESLVGEARAKLGRGRLQRIDHEMGRCAIQRNPERPGWEKICNFKLLNPREKVYIRHFFMARDALARKADVPAARILAKQLVVAMARSGTWEGIIPPERSMLAESFEKARLDAERELSIAR